MSIHSFILYLHSIDPILVTLTRGCRNRQTKLICKIYTKQSIHSTSVKKIIQEKSTSVRKNKSLFDVVL